MVNAGAAAHLLVISEILILLDAHTALQSNIQAILLPV